MTNREVLIFRGNFQINSVKKEQILTQKNIHFLLNFQAQSQAQTRMRLMALFLLQTGVRLSEMLYINPSLITEQGTMVAIPINTLKGGRKRSVSISLPFYKSIRKIFKSNLCLFSWWNHSKRRYEWYARNSAHRGIKHIFDLLHIKHSAKDLRHTYASFRLEELKNKGLDLHYSLITVSQELGHTSPDITFTTYIHLIGETQKTQDLF